MKPVNGDRDIAFVSFIARSICSGCSSAFSAVSARHSVARPDHPLGAQVAVRSFLLSQALQRSVVNPFHMGLALQRVAHVVGALRTGRTLPLKRTGTPTFTGASGTL